MSADTQQRMGEAVSAQAGVASFLLEWKLLLEQPSSGCAVTGGRGVGNVHPSWAGLVKSDQFVS